MNWYYVDAGQQAGPVDDAQLQDLVRSGKVQPETLVWHEGMASWAAYREVAPSATAPEGEVAGAPPLIAPPPEGIICSECGRAFGPSDVIRYGDKWVCATCKPLFFQRLREGAGPGSSGTGVATEADLLARDYEVDIGGCLNRGWEAFKANAGLVIGASVLVYLALIAINMVPYLNIPLGLILTGPLMGGLWVFFIKNLRNEQTTIGDAFSGFGPRFWQLVLTQIIPGLIGMGVMMLIGAMAVPAIMLGSRAVGRGGGGGIAPALLVPLGIVAFIAIIVVIYFNICWMFALPLAGDKGLKFWPALELSRRVVNKHWGMTFLMVVVSGLITFVGIIACFVGVLVTGPVAFAMLACHYQRVFGDLAPNQA
jgi:hypothetical protein